MTERTKQIHEKGFTIVELLIATAVFSMVLVIVTIGFISLSNRYYKGVITANTQSTTRNVTDVLRRNIQFSTTGVTAGESNGVKFICTNGLKFFFRYNVKYLGAQSTETNPGLFMQPYNSNCASEQLNRSLGTQLLGENMSVVDLRSIGIGSSYTLSVRIAYGDLDMFCSSSLGVSCSDANASLTTDQLRFAIPDLACKQGVIFCATSGTEFMVHNRMAGN